MSDSPDDIRILAAFDDYRREALPRIDPPGFAPVLATARIRRRTRMIAVAALVVVAIGVPVAVGRWVGPTGSRQPASASSTPPSATASPSTPSSTSPSPGAGRVAACTAGDVAAHVGRSGSLANQPFAMVVVTNQSDRACTLRGYPQLSHVRAHRAGGPDGPLSVTVRDGSNYEYADPGPSSVRLDPGGQVSFALGTATAGGGPLYTVTSLRIAIGGGEVTVPVSLAIAAVPGHGFMISTTAYAPGTNAGS
jgi:hypothetical protein